MARAASPALAVGIGYYAPTVTAKIDDNAQVNSAGSLSVTAMTQVPFEVPQSANAFEGDVLYDSANPSYNPLNFINGLVTDSMFGVGTDILNNTASASVAQGDAKQTSLAGNIQVFVYSINTDATIGDAKINQKTQDPDALDALGSSLGISFRSGSQSVAVSASTQYDNAAEDGNFFLNLSPSSFIDTLQQKGAKAAFQGMLKPTGDASGQNAIGASAFIDVLNNSTLATIDTGAQIVVGPMGTLQVTADQKIIAFSLVQSGDSGGNVGIAGELAWYNLTSVTRAQIEDGVTVNGGENTSNQVQPGGVVLVNADDNTILVGVTGGVVLSNGTGVGFAVSVNNVSRTNPGPDRHRSDADAHDRHAGDLRHLRPACPRHRGRAGHHHHLLRGIGLAERGPGQEQQQPGQPVAEEAELLLAGRHQPRERPERLRPLRGGVGQRDAERHRGVRQRPWDLHNRRRRALTITPSAQSAYNIIHFSGPTGLATGTPVVYTATTPIGGLTSSTTYYVISIDPYDIQLAMTDDDAANGTAITLAPWEGYGTQTLTPATGTALTFDPSTVESTIINFVAPHGLQTGEMVEYKTNPGGGIGGLTDGTIYYAIVLDPNHIELAEFLHRRRGGQGDRAGLLRCVRQSDARSRSRSTSTRRPRRSS